MLSDRRQRVLAALIEEYVARALPVGSRTLTERYKLGVSPATVRNELSVLEDDGYITQPHTSAGRIPTDFGYRAFVDSLLEDEQQQNDAVVDKAMEDLRRNATELDSLIEQTGATLTRMTDCLSVVLAPSVVTMRIKQISLVSLTPYRAIVVVVTEDGRVFNRQMEFGTEVSGEELARVQSLLSEIFTGRSVDEVSSKLGSGMTEAIGDPLLRLSLEEVLSCLRESRAGRSQRLGLQALLTQPEFSNSNAVLPLMQVLEDDTVLLHVLDSVSGAGSVGIHIGTENDLEHLNGVSVVASKYGRADSMGVVAVIGPTRMDYSKVIQAVRAASRTLGDE